MNRYRVCTKCGVQYVNGWPKSCSIYYVLNNDDDTKTGYFCPTCGPMLMAFLNPGVRNDAGTLFDDYSN